MGPDPPDQEKSHEHLREAAAKLGLVESTVHKVAGHHGTKACKNQVKHGAIDGLELCEVGHVAQQLPHTTVVLRDGGCALSQIVCGLFHKAGEVVARTVGLVGHFKL